MDTTPTVTSPSCNEKSPMLASGETYSNTFACSAIGDGEAAGVSEAAECEDEKVPLLSSEQHKAKDFQLIHVPKGAVSDGVCSVCTLSTLSSLYYLGHTYLISCFLDPPTVLLNHPPKKKKNSF